MVMTRRQFITRSGQVVGGVILASSLSSRAPAQTKKYGGTIKWGNAEFPKSFDPAMFTTFAEFPLCFLVYNHLVGLSHEDLSPIPELAATWESKDAKAWIFHLRKDVEWHNGRKFDAEDVVYTMQRWMDPSTVAHTVSGAANFESVQALDKYTVRLNLKAPYGNQPLRFAEFQCSILPHWNQDLRKNPIGTGAFVFEDAIPGEKLTLKKNNKYWKKGLPYLDRFTEVIIPENNTQIASLISGEIDACYQVPFEWIPKLRENPNTNVLTLPCASFTDVRMRADKKPFNDNKVRLAFKYCLNREAFTKAAIGGNGVPGNDLPIAPWNKYFDNTISLRKQDYGKAKQLLAEAGYPNGLTVTLYSSSARVAQLETAITLKEQCKPAGIEIDVKNIEPARFWAEHWKDSDFNCGNWSFRIDPDVIFRQSFYTGSSWNYSRYSNPELDNLLDVARKEASESKRKEMYSKAQRIIFEDGPWLVPTLRNDVIGLRKGVHWGVDKPPHGYTNTWLEQTWKE